MLKVNCLSTWIFLLFFRGVNYFVSYIMSSYELCEITVSRIKLIVGNLEILKTRIYTVII